MIIIMNIIIIYHIISTLSTGKLRRHRGPAQANYLVKADSFGAILYDSRSISDGFRAPTRSGTLTATLTVTHAAGAVIRAPIVSRAFATTVIATRRQRRFYNGSVRHLLHGHAPVGFTIASACHYTAVAGLRTYYHDIEQVRRRLGAHLVHMQHAKQAIESDNYGGTYLKFGHASGAGQYQPADAWILPSHDMHMEPVALVFALMPALQRFGAVCLRHAGAEPDGCQFSLLNRQVRRMGLDVSAHHSSPSFVVRGSVGSTPCGAHCDPDRDEPQVFVYMDHPHRNVPPGKAPASQLGVASGSHGGLTVELPTDNSTAPYRAVTGVVCNPSQNLHFTIDEGEGNKDALSLLRVIFYHNTRTAHASNILDYPSGPLKQRTSFTCPACRLRVESPHVNRAHWIHHFDAAVDRARGVTWTCGCCAAE
jgi:hypothetical protein